MTHRLFIFICLSFLIACTSVQKSISPAEYLTEEVAIDRARRVSAIEYNIKLSIDAVSERFTGTNEISFSLTDTLNDLPLDFRDGKVDSLIINGTSLKRAPQVGPFLILSKEHLIQGVNKVTINYSQAYQNTGVGLHRFTDPEDNQTYLYTQFEPYDANRFAPLFDQPDLKAPLKLTVSAPANWTVISVGAVEKTSLNEKNIKTWNFKTTAVIPTYVYALHAGPYYQWTSNYKNIPLRLFARKSLAKYVRADEWFKITKQGFEFFEKYFDTPYPFVKYDQVLTPEFNFGAMENVAAVTFSEKFISRGTPTRQERQNTANVILHEMAHMWFGNLTTMRWWNGLWLNETFATYMATLALASNTEFRDEAWQEFFGEKAWAMYEDQLVTTHPIDAEIENTEQAFSNFDGITYGKGAAVMKQLSYYLGETQFQKGTQNYFKKYAYKNTELSDFLAALESASNLSLNQWSDQWLKTTGVDNFEWTTTCQNQKLTGLTVQLRAKSLLRPHAIEWSAGKIVNGRWNTLISQKIRIEQPTTTLRWDLPTSPCPDFVLLNDKDHGYMKVSYNNQQIEWIKENLKLIPDPLYRLLVVHSLWEAVRDQELTVQTYYGIVRKHLDSETSPRVIGYILDSFTGFDSEGAQSVFNYWPQKSDADITSRLMTVRQFEKFLYQLSIKTKLSLDTRKKIWDSLVSFSETPEFREELYDLWLRKKFPIELDPDRRWSVIIRLCALNSEECKSLIDKELLVDKSERAEKASLIAKASQPNIELKRSFYNQIVNAKADDSFDKIRSIAQGLFPAKQSQFKSGFENDMYQLLKGPINQMPEHFQETLSVSLNPTRCEASANIRLKAFLKDNKVSDIALRSLKVALQEDERCLSIRAKSSQEQSKIYTE